MDRSFTVTVNFTLVGYNLTFNENGLPDNYVWYVDLADGYSSGSIHNNSYPFHLINGRKMDGNSSISMKLVSGNYTLSIMWNS